MQLFTENVVVTANLFNVSLIQQIWLVENEIVLRDEFTGTALFTPGIVQLETPLFSLLAIPNQIQMQFTAQCPENQKQQIVSDRLGRFIRELPHTPYSAIGVNFTWHYKPTGNQTIAEVSRRAFFRDSLLGARMFNSPNAEFGAYYSTDEGVFRLKLTIGPVSVPRPEQPPEDVLQFAFNYHRDTSNNVPGLIDALSHWRDAKQHSALVIREMEAAL